LDDFVTNFSYEEAEDLYWGYEDWYDIQVSILNNLKPEITEENT